MKNSVYRIVNIAVMAAILLVAQVSISFIPNIELVSFLIIVYTLHDAKSTKWCILIFVLVEGLIYGFHTWWITYLYIWYILYFLVLLSKKHTNNKLYYSVLSGFFGLFFGTLSAIPYFIMLGFAGGVAYIIAGIPFDLAHCIGNFVLCFLLFTPMNKIMSQIKNKL